MKVGWGPNRSPLKTYLFMRDAQQRLLFPSHALISARTQACRVLAFQKKTFPSILPPIHPSREATFLTNPPPPSTDSPAAGGNASGSSGRCVFVFRGRSPGRGEALAPLRPFLQYFSLRLRTVLKFYLFPPRTPRWVCGCASWWWSAIRQACLELIDSTLLKNLIRKILPTTCGRRLPTHSTASLAGE